MKLMRFGVCLIGLISGMTIAAAQSAKPDTVAWQNGMESVQVSKAGGSILIKINLREPLKTPPSNFSIANPARLVFDLPATENALGYTSKTINEGGLRSLNVVQAGDRSRLVLNLDKMARFETRQEGKTLYISLQESGPDGATVATSSTAVQRFAGGEHKDQQGIRDIQFRRGKDGAALVMVDLTAPDTGIDIQQKGTSLLVSFKKTRLPDHLRKQLDVVDFATPVSVVRTKSQGEDVSMEIVPKGLWEHTAFQTDNQFVIEVRPLKEDPNKLFQGSKTGYQGEAISLNFQNIPLRELLHVFADITNFNIVISDSVGGNVSLRLNDVAWDHALEIVLQQKNLAMRKSGNVLWIAPREELAARDKLEADARDAAISAEQPRLEVFQMNYQKAEDFANLLTGGAGASAAPDQKPAGFLSALGKATVDKRTNQVFVYDVPSKLDLVQGLLKKVDRPARQVLIEARIVEADTSFAKALGARLGGHDHYGMDVGHKILGSQTRYGIAASSQDAYTHLAEKRPLINANTGNLSYLPGNSLIGATGYQNEDTITREVSAPTTLDPSQFANNPIAGAAGQFALTLFNSAKTQLLTLELTALEQDGMGKAISSPRVLTADQVEASIEQGFRIPYPTASSSGAIAIAYVNATLSLKVKPQITPDGRVMMNIKINKDAPGEEGRWGYSIRTKEIKSDVLVENGGTVVIGGVFEQTETETSSRVPFLGDLPYVGFMFKQKRKSEVKSELIIMLTPKIVDDGLSVKL